MEMMIDGEPAALKIVGEALGQKMLGVLSRRVRPRLKESEA